MGDFSQCDPSLGRLLEEAEAVLIGAGAGLSTSAGLSYGGERFTKLFGDFQKRYRFTDMYAGGFFPFPTPEARWAYWSRFIACNRYDTPENPVYNTMLSLVQDKDYFVLTTNVDHQFQLAGFDKNRLFYTQGDYGLFQCAVPCCQETFDNEEAIRGMVSTQKNLEIPSSLLPRCPHCGQPMTMNLRSDHRFVENAGWHRAADRYERFLHTYTTQRHTPLLLLELGVGYNTPGIIKHPFQRLAARYPHIRYASINTEQFPMPPELQDRSLFLQGDIGTLLGAPLGVGKAASQ